MDHPTLSDGITDEEVKIVALLGSTNRRMPELVDALLNGNSVFLEERMIELPETGQVLLTIIRLRDVKTASMDVLEQAVRVNEAYMGEPYYTNWIAAFFSREAAEVEPRNEAHHCYRRGRLDQQRKLAERRPHRAVVRCIHRCLRPRHWTGPWR